MHMETEAEDLDCLKIKLGELREQLPFSKHFGAFQKLMDKLNGIAKENLRGTRVVKSFVQEKEQAAKFDANSDELLGHNLVVSYIFSVMIPAFTFAAYIAIFAAIWFVSTYVEKAPKDLASIASFMTYMMQIMFAIIMGGMMSMMASRAFISLKRIGEVIHTEPAMYFKDTEDIDLSGDLEFDKVSFSYPSDDELTLENISFSIKKTYITKSAKTLALAPYILTQ